MQKLLETLKSFGVEIPTDKQTEVKKALSENYKNINEHNKAIGKLETDRDSWKERAETAESTLKGFEGVDIKEIKSELEKWKSKAENAEKDYANKIAQRDFEDALKTEIENYKFTSEAAKKSVIAEIRAADLKQKDGKILGLSDFIDQIRKNDASAFVDDAQAAAEQNKAKFTEPMGKPAAGAYSTKEEIMKIKDPMQRQKAIAQNISLFRKEE